MDGDSEANYAYYCLHKFHWPPSKFLDMSDREQAFVIASIDLRIETEKKEAAKLKK